MRILTISGLFPPFSLGGAENSAANLAMWLARNNHEVSVLTAATSQEDESFGGKWHGLSIWRRLFPRPYPVYKFPESPTWKKPQWHLQDLFDPRNSRIVGEVLDIVKPSVALVHIVPGIGFNALSELALRDIPVVYYLHELGLACIKGPMFKNGHNCKKQCMLCKITSGYKYNVLRRFNKIGFCSPSQANLDQLRKFVPLAARPCITIPNANKYPQPTLHRKTSKKVRFLYAGRLHPQKGVSLILQILDELGDRYEFTLRIVGGGQSEASLREQYQHKKWCSFTGHVSQLEVTNEMVNADVLLVPSLWLENSPGVVIEALSLGLPVVGSDIGGIPELVSHDVNGLLLNAGDRSAWLSGITQILVSPSNLSVWRKNAELNAKTYSQDELGNQHQNFMYTIAQAAAIE